MMHLLLPSGKTQQLEVDDPYWHRAPREGAFTYCGISTVGAERCGPPPSSVKECPVCARA